MSTSEHDRKSLQDKPPRSGSVQKKASDSVKEKKLQFRHSESMSDSEDSDEDSPSVSSVSSPFIESSVSIPGSNHGSASVSSHGKPAQSKARKGRKSRNRRDWEIMEGLREGQRCEQKPEKYEGYLMKKRKWPMKGWHKRFFVLDKGIMTYAKSSSDIQKGKYHGVVDCGLSVVAFRQQRQRLYIDAEESIYHIKIKDKTAFNEWMNRLKHHRLYRQHEIAYGTKETPRLSDITSPNEDLSPLGQNIAFPEQVRTGSFKRSDILRQASIHCKTSPILGGNKVATWLLDSAGIERCNRDLIEAKRQLFELSDILQKIESLPLTPEHGADRLISDVDHPHDRICDHPPVIRKKSGSLAPAILGRKKSTKAEKIQKRELSNRHSITGTMLTPTTEKMILSTSNPNLIDIERDKHCPARPASIQSYSRSFSNNNDAPVRKEFVLKAQDVTDLLKSLIRIIATERDRFKNAFEQENLSVRNSSKAMTALKNTLSETQRQNTELRAKLARIHNDSCMSDIAPVPQPTDRGVTSPAEQEVPRSLLVHSNSLDSIAVSDYYDAEDNIMSSDSSSEGSDEEDASSELSDDNDTANRLSASEDIMGPVPFHTGRRSKLPVPKPDAGDISLWSLLCKNIGKDLSKISMPVTLNEPLNMLQKMCEELEYSELLDKAAECDDPYERMLYVTAFAVSPYAAAYYRAGHKPFNPLLEETYENIREDKGWRFIAEQVSHHPPISAGYCESKNFLFWQDVRIKTKFWGRSMEIQPVGTVNVTLPKYRDHYTWNKVTTCVHNIFGGQRWVDQYGEIIIKNRDIRCKLTFAKASQWSSKQHDVWGTITNPEGKAVHHLFGTWHEALFYGHAPSAKCIWRPGAMPDDHDLYYGFSRFAIELNELDHEQTNYLPPTDSRFRLDQRLLEEGDIEGAEEKKTRLEQMQRERRKKREDEGLELEPRWFRKVGKSGKEEYEYTGRYWEQRKEPGFMKMSFSKLW